MGLITTIHAEETELIKELKTLYNWKVISPDEQKSTLIRNYFGGTNLTPEQMKQAYSILDLLATVIKPEFWYEEALKKGIGSTEHHSVIVVYDNPELLNIAEMYGYLTISKHESHNPTILMTRDKKTEAVINELRDSVKDLENSERMD